MKPIVIVGAGIGGLSAAIRLAAHGLRVAIYEQNNHIGGKMGEAEVEGFRFDTGPSVITMRPVFEDLFAAAGRRLSDYLTLLPVDPLTRYFYPDGTRLDVTRDLSGLLPQIEALSPRDVDGYLRYLAHAARIQRLTSEVFISGPPPSLRSFTGVSPFDALRIDPLRTMAGSIRSFVRDPRLRQLLGRFATYVGASPYLAPATLNVIAAVELAGGVWYPQGGIYAVARAYERLARELGVEIHPGTRVERIEVRGGRVSGVGTAAGEFVAAERVIANVDVATVYSRLLPPGTLPPGLVARTLSRPRSCSGFLLLLGLDRQHPDLAHHNIFFSRDYRREFDDIFRREIMPGEPTVYVAITSKTDPAHAPPGCENWFVMANAPALGPAWDWNARAAAYRERVLNVLAEFGHDVRPAIRCERMLTPVDIEHQTGAYRGALYGASSNERLAAFLRPHNRSRRVPGLYFAGGTTHPGGGVPMVTLSGAVAAGMVLEDLDG